MCCEGVSWRLLAHIFFSVFASRCNGSDVSSVEPLGPFLFLDISPLFFHLVLTKYIDLMRQLGKPCGAIMMRVCLR